ncbi:MAG TPA: hypothetical protein VF169_10680 [Albitalea sp.]|uniref:hypothetical protein n=1 Tax=Piscinibacter sp. TaxID=1903157 RepID=UPI002ED67E8C
MAIDVYLGLGEGATVAQGDALWQAHAQLEPGLDALFGQAAATVQRRWGRRVPVRVWLSSALARPFLCGPLAGLRRWREVVALAEAAATEGTGLPGPCQVMIEEWPHPQPALAVAVQAQTLDAIESAARRHSLRVQSLRPWWAAALDHALSRGPDARLLAVSDGDGMTVLGGRERFDTANGYVPAPSAEQADKVLARLALTAGLQPADVVRVRLSRTAAPHDGLPFGAMEEQTLP